MPSAGNNYKTQVAVVGCNSPGLLLGQLLNKQGTSNIILHHVCSDHVLGCIRTDFTAEQYVGLPDEEAG
ncbi:hypothetical protein [uncultured Sneathiella sp.]|uniref:hypothetical protein n=1 Tax=uncultured Sneathiella sp. TaxID=879315 RepID=UPI0030EF2B23|tara:strand:+ start:12234 stop:12440 length:207 start_codon:yes stop_codon:yes gene_type:complete